MKFVDEVKIEVEAGAGGHGCLSFRREKFVARGGPDGGDGGDGGSVFLRADSALNTLVDLSFQPRRRAGSGRPGAGRGRTGRGGEDLLIPVPVGTGVIDVDTQELIADLSRPGETVMVARGGRRGLGNTRFKSSTNRAPRKTTRGAPGEARTLLLQLRLLADVGLLGPPNAGKSTLIRAVSAAAPKVADYPFTTLTPNLGVVRVDRERSFVMADIPGLVEGAARGAGLGIRFLKHLSRARLLLHLVDPLPADGGDPAAVAGAIVRELARFSPALASRPRWLAINKADLIDAEAAAELKRALARELDWTGEIHEVSGLTGEGCGTLCGRLMTAVEEHRRRLDGEADYQAAQADLDRAMAFEMRRSIERARAGGPRREGADG